MEYELENATKLDDARKHEIDVQYDILLSRITSIFGESTKRTKALLKFYKAYEEPVKFAPASGKLNYHNAFIGGYLDHILRVDDLAHEQADLMEKHGGVTGCTREELSFAALHHDLGKLGMPGVPYYQIQDDDWWQKKKLEVFTHNDNIQYMKVSDITLYLLQEYGITYTQNEMLGMKLADGLYEDSNEAYLKSRSGNFPMRTNIGLIIHWADHMASRIEHDRIRLKYTT